MDETKGLKIIHVNIRSLAPKIDLLRVWVDLHKPNIITLSETWLNNNISDNEINLTNYVLYRSERCSRGDGVAIYVSSDLASELIIPTVAPLHFECIFVKITFHTNKCIAIGSIYRPPSSPAESFDCIVSTISSIPCKCETVL